jgi:glycosyltransferase involved in cell wall biosynthesis
VAYKRFEIVIEAFNRLRMPLKVFGDGPARPRLMNLAKPNIEFLGFCSREKLARAYAECLAFVQPQEEDFGITAIEAMASGRPVIAYGAGGALEAVLSDKTGVFFQEQSWEALADAVARFEPSEFNSAIIRTHAERFSEVEFKINIQRIINEAWATHSSAHEFVRGQTG